MEPLAEQPAGAPRVPPGILQRVPEWRRKWTELWGMEIAGDFYAFRSPTRGEAIGHEADMALSEPLAVDILVHTCLLSPTQLADSMPWRVVTCLYNAIWRVSGFGDSDAFQSKLSLFDAGVRSPDSQYILLLLKTFPGLLPKEINEWQPDELVYHIALAKALNGIPAEDAPQDERQRRAALLKRRALAQRSGTHCYG